MLQPPSHTTSTQVQPISSPTQVFDGPITRSRAKKLQQEVHQRGRTKHIKGESTRRAMSESVQRYRTVQKKQSYLLIPKSYEGP
jgi:polyhydroxyalkanoate synthesis regulator phasin